MEIPNMPDAPEAVNRKMVKCKHFFKWAAPHFTTKINSFFDILHLIPDDDVVQHVYQLIIFASELRDLMDNFPENGSILDAEELTKTGDEAINSFLALERFINSYMQYLDSLS